MDPRPLRLEILVGASGPVVADCASGVQTHRFKCQEKWDGGEEVVEINFVILFLLELLTKLHYCVITHSQT